MSTQSPSSKNVKGGRGEMIEPAPTYQAVTAPRNSQVQRTAVSSSSTVITHKSGRRHSIEQDIPDIRNVLDARQHSKKEMQTLNERLANHIEKSRYLQAQNKKLKDELNGLKNRWGKETEKIRQMYDVELKQLRRLLDDAERLKGEKDAKISSLDSHNKDMREQLQESASQMEQYSEKLERMYHELSDRDGEIALLRRRLGHLDEEKGKVRAQMNKMKEELSRLHTDLDAETASRIGADAENQTLREELEFLKRVHDQEIKELQALIKRDDDDSREFWRNELGQAIHDIMKEYDDKVDAVRIELETMYNNKMREMAKGPQSGNSESVYLREENKKIKELLQELRSKIADLQSRNDQLERALQDMQQQFETERRRFSEEHDRLEKDLRSTEADLQRVLSELTVLLDAKLSLELEIAAYKKLLDADETRSVERSGSAAGRTSSSTREVVQERRRNSPPPQSTEDRPTRSTRAEITARTQYDKSFKGNACIEECSQDGKYILLANVGNRRERMNNWRIVRNIDNGRATVRHQIVNLNLDPGESLKIWAKGLKPFGSTDQEMSSASWGTGANVQTLLFNEEGQERAMHLQRTVYSGSE